MFRLFRRRRSPPVDAATARLRGLTAALPREQVSHSPDLDGLLTHFEDALAGYPRDTRSRIIKVFRMLAQSDDDVAGTIRDLTSLAITPFTWELAGSEAAQAQAEAALEAWRDSVFPTGLSGLAEHQAREAYITGATSLEWVPQPDAQGVLRAEPVPAEEIRIRRGEGGEREYRQVPPTRDPILLDPRTYHYGPLTLDGNSPYGVPAMISTLHALARKAELTKGENRLINAAAKIALVMASVTPPEPSEFGLLKGDPAYQGKLQEYMRQVAELIASGSERGLYAHPNTVELTTTNVNQNLQGATDITERNQKQIWSGLGTQPFMRGDMGANYALAKVIYPTMLAFAETLRGAVASQLEFGMNLHLRLQGIPAQAWLVFQSPPNPFRLDDAQAAKAEAETDELMLKLIGDAWLPKLSSRWDVTVDDIEAARAARRDGSDAEG